MKAWSSARRCVKCGERRGDVVGYDRIPGLFIHAACLASAPPVPYETIAQLQLELAHSDRDPPRGP